MIHASNNQRDEHVVSRQEGDLLCLCGNSDLGDGFFPCDESGNEMLPDIGSNWMDLYVCARCGRIIDQKTLRVIGQSPHPTFLQ